MADWTKEQKRAAVDKIKKRTKTFFLPSNSDIELQCERDALREALDILSTAAYLHKTLVPLPVFLAAYRAKDLLARIPK